MKTNNQINEYYGNKFFHSLNEYSKKINKCYSDEFLFISFLDKIDFNLIQLLLFYDNIQFDAFEQLVIRIHYKELKKYEKSKKNKTKI